MIQGKIIYILNRLIDRLNLLKSALDQHNHSPKSTWEKINGLPKEQRDISSLRNLINYTKEAGKAYSATSCPAGYHSIEINGDILEGQRNPKLRLNSIPFDFTNKTVLDIGCNQGGMLFEIADSIKWGVGIDYDPKMINVCNKIIQIKKQDNLGFYICDVDTENHALIQNFLPEDRLDIIFLLSVCMWIKEWKNLINFCASISETLLFESNGNSNVQTEQYNYLNLKFKQVSMLRDKSDDDRFQLNRKLYIARHPKDS